MQSSARLDLLTGGLAIALAAGVAWVTLRYPPISGNFPFALSAYLIAPVGGLLLLKGLLRLAFDARAETEPEEEPADAQLVRFTPVTIATIAAVVVATFAIGWLGFVAATGLLALVMGVVFRARPWVTLVYAAAQCAVLWGFLRFFSIQMPQGLLL